MSPALREHSAAADPPSGIPVVSFEEARSALAGNEPEVALAAAKAALEGDSTQQDPRLDDWERLRDQALSDVRMRAERHRRAGEPGAAARWLGLLLRYDARAANSVHLAWDQPVPVDAPPVDGSDGVGKSSAAGLPGGRRTAPVGGQGPVPVGGQGPVPVGGQGPVPVGGQGPLAIGAARRFRWAIDAAGEFLCLVVDEVVLASGGETAPRLVRRPSLRGGGSWCLVRGAASALVDGREPQRDCLRLRSGARVELASTAERPRVCFTLRCDDPGSQSARLELERGLEAEGAQGLLLMAEGRAGRVSVGAGVRSLIRCDDLDQALELWIEGDGLHLRSPRRGTLQRGEESLAVTPGSEQHLAWPLRSRADLELAPTRPGSPPLWMRVEPL
ncbi:hypothetical protein [Engelhardtia mirabilis]|uniref:hypothetical protein n=1 Tax=Engelhardtia mirabilis TaxID=2528011 RepID=UPI0011A7D002